MMPALDRLREMTLTCKPKFLAAAAVAAMLCTAPGHAQPNDDYTLSEAEYFEADGANVLVFSNWYDGLFADSKISGVEIIQQGERIATNGDVRLSPTPGQWDAIGRMVERKVDRANGRIEVALRSRECISLRLDCVMPLPCEGLLCQSGWRRFPTPAH